MTKINGYIVDSDYTEIDGQTFVQFFGRLENQESFVVVNKFNPYFFVKTEEVKKIRSILKSFEIEETDLTSFSKEKVSKISCSSQEKINKIVKILHDKEIDTFEADLRPYVRYLIDRGIKGGMEIDGEYEISERVNRVYKNVDISSSTLNPKLKILSIDIESGKKDDELYCIGLYSENFEKTFMVTNKKFKNVISCKDAEECLTKFRQEVLDFDPDILTGWNFVSFDLNYLNSLFKKNKLSFDIGRAIGNIRIKIEENYFKASTAKIIGRQVIDGLAFIKDPFIQEAPSIKSQDFESYTLENVSQQILGKGKLLKGENRHDEIEYLYHSKKESDLQKLIDYNLLDCKLVYEILEKTKMIDLAIERTQLTGLTMDRLTASVAAFDSVYIYEARKRKLVSPTTRFGNKEERIKGGFVMSPKPGIYHNIAVFDFKSLYPSIIRTFNIDPSSYLIKKEANCIESPNGAFFLNQDGILPSVLENLHHAREKAKKEKRELASYAIKIIMNSFFGVLASPNSRYFNLKIGNAITNFGQEIIKLTSKKIEEMGYQVIYGDTDSVFVSLGEKYSDKLANEISEKIDKFYKEYVEKNYSRKSYLDLEFDKLFVALMMPAVRTKSKDDEEEKNLVGAKKRYAGLILENGKEELEVTGLEAIRGDWTEAAGSFQKQLLIKVFHKEDPVAFIKKFVRDLSAGKMDEALIYRKAIRKDLGEYIKTTPPHVKAARKLDKIDSNIISYYMTLDGPEPIQKVKHKIDYEHYVEKQIKPVADQVLVLFGKNFDDILKGTKQSTLF